MKRPSSRDTYAMRRALSLLVQAMDTLGLPPAMHAAYARGITAFCEALVICEAARDACPRASTRSA